MKKIFSLNVLLILFCCAFAGNFTASNLVVLRVGDGASALSSSAAPVFLDEYTITGVLVQSVALPTAVSGSNHALTLSGSAGSEGSLVLSANGQYLSFAGYDAAPGLVKVSSDSVTNRTIGYVGANGIVNTSTGINAGSAYVKNNIRGAVTNNGTSFWCAGTGSGSTAGMWYLSAGSFTSSAIQVSSTENNIRVANIFGGQLYTSSGAGAYHGVNAVGSGMPVTTGQTMTNLPGMPGADTTSSTYGFWLFDENPNVAGYDVMYICDDHTGNNGGLYKYSLVGGTWVSNGNISSGIGLRGIAAKQNCSGVQLYVTDATAIYSLADNSGYNAALTGTLTTLVPAGTNTMFHGVAFTPGSSSSSGIQASVSGSNNVTCNGQSNGSITLSVNGGANYSYAWSDGSVTTQNRSNLGAGTYTVTVTSSGCTATASATISQPAALSVSAQATNISCFGGNNGSITVNPTGGTPGYIWTPSGLNNLSSGSYNITVTDANSCTATVSAQVSQPTAISVSDTIVNLPCSGGGNIGAVHIGVSGGTPGFSYVWNNNSHTQNLNNLAAGTYSVTITDANSCSASLTAIVSNAGSLNVQQVANEVTCNGLSNGSISITPAGGTSPYQYSWSNNSTTQNLSNIPAGSYVVTVTDNAGCTLISSISVTQPQLLSAVPTSTNVSCFGLNNGLVNLAVTGGTTPYSYAWTGTSDVGQNIGNLSSGNYLVTVSDANHCTASASANVSAPDSISLNFTITNVSASGASDGHISLTVSGGTSAYTYNWSNNSTTQNLSNLTAGNYCVTVTDQNNCSVDRCETVSQPTGIDQMDWAQYFEVVTMGSDLLIDAVFTQDMNCGLQIYDMTGRLIYNMPQNICSSILHLRLDESRLTSGCYLVRIATGQGTMSRKVEILR